MYPIGARGVNPYRGVCIGDYPGEYYRGYEGDTRSLDSTRTLDCSLCRLNHSPYAQEVGKSKTKPAPPNRDCGPDQRVLCVLVFSVFGLPTKNIVFYVPFCGSRKIPMCLFSALVRKQHMSWFRCSLVKTFYTCISHNCTRFFGVCVCVCVHPTSKITMCFWAGN